MVSQSPRAISFAMGRPDTLGADPSHNHRYPLVRDAETTDPSAHESSNVVTDPPYCGIIKPMVDFSRITRKVCLRIYLQDSATAGTVSIANEIESALDGWVNNLPPSIRPQTKFSSQPETLRSAKEPKWAKRQKLVLLIRKLAH